VPTTHAVSPSRYAESPEAVTGAIARDGRGVAVVARVGPYRACHPQLDVPVTVTTAPLVITPTEPGSRPGLSALGAEHPTDARHPIAATIVEIGATLRGRRTGGPGIPLETGNIENWTLCRRRSVRRWRIGRILLCRGSYRRRNDRCASAVREANASQSR
jgi:hypothetical protein